MRICLVTENFKPFYGGQYTAIQNVKAICDFQNLNYYIIHKETKAYKSKVLLDKLILNSDIVHIFGGWTFFYFKIHKLALKFNKKIIIHSMGLFEPQSFRQKKIKKKIAWNLYQKQMLVDADLIHCGSNTEEKNLKNLNKNFKTIILPFSVKRKNIKKKILKKIKRKCIFFSRLHNQKGLDKLIKAWQAVNNKNWKLDIVGFGNKNFYIKKFKLYKYKNIRFLKPVVDENKKIKLFDKYDFLALPSLSESFGLAILEALARRIAVLTTNKTPWEEIQKKNCGWLINDSLIELKLVLNQIFNSSQKEIYEKKKNTIKVSNKFNIQKVSKLYLNCYKKLCKI